MRKVGSTTDTADANGEYTNGNVANGISPTIINAEMLNTFQRELVNVVEGSGLTLDPNDDGQVLKALNKIIGNCITVEKNDKGLYLKAVNVFGLASIVIQSGSGVINSQSGTVTFPKPFPNAVLAVIPSKTADANRYVSSANYSLSSFDIFGWVPGGTGNVDNFSYIAVGW